MTERGILFSGAMVRALLDGTKTQTRRPAKPRRKPSLLDGTWSDAYVLDPGNREWLMDDNPYGQPGDHLWVRETYQPLWAEGIERESQTNWTTGAGYCVSYPATDGVQEFMDADDNLRSTCKPSIHMPRWASRILLEIVSVRAERLQDISEADAVAEGVEPNWCGDLTKGPNGFGGQGWIPDCGWINYLSGPDGEEAYTAVESYRTLWESINGAGSWEANPWVWVVEFKRVM